LQQAIIKFILLPMQQQLKLCVWDMVYIC
jgi:hypothetical protein